MLFGFRYLKITLKERGLYWKDIDGSDGSEAQRINWRLPKLALEVEGIKSSQEAGTLAFISEQEEWDQHLVTGVNIL